MRWIKGLAAGTALLIAAASSVSGEEPKVYADLLAAGMGAVVGAAHPRVGIVFPFSEKLSWAIESEVYYTAPDSDSFLQVDALAIARFHPWPGNVHYLGAGIGCGWASSKGDGTTAFAGILGVEAGTSFSPFGKSIYLEPFVRGYAVAGSDISAGGEIGFRAGWIF